MWKWTTALLLILLIGSNGWWLYQAIDLAVTEKYLQQEEYEADARKQVIDYCLDEIAFVGGEATVIWHHRVFHSDYGWGDDYKYLLDGIKSRELETSVV